MTFIKEKKKSNYDDDRTREDFPIAIRVVFWLLMGAIVSLIWIPLAPAILSLPLGLNRFALNLGWKPPSMTDEATQYYWSWIFLAQYIGWFVFGAMTWGADFSYPKKES